MTRIRRKGVALVETRRGILVVAGRSKKFTLPGGGADKGESRRRASTRELKEETGLRSKSSKFLFEYKGRKWTDFKGRTIQNDAKVFLVKADGRAKPMHEIKHVDYWTPENKVKISRSTEMLINKYLKMKN